MFAASTAGQAALDFIPQRLALPTGCAALIAGMGLLALGLASSDLALLVLSGVIAGFGQALGMRAGLTAVNGSASPERRGEVASSFFVALYLAISLPVIGEGFLAQSVGLRPAGLIFAAAVAGLASVVLILVGRHSAGGQESSRPLMPAGPRRERDYASAVARDADAVSHER